MKRAIKDSEAAQYGALARIGNYEGNSFKPAG
jgi:hypothetical protein